MKREIILLTLLFTVCLFSSCDKNNIDFDDKYEKSYREWLNFKKSSNNSYDYTVRGISWVGLTWETRISVSKGVITQREFKYTRIDGQFEDISDNDMAWIEYQEEIDSHPESSAAAPLTLDEIYAIAKNEWLVKRDDVKTYFEANNGGLISNCGYVPNDCADDCFTGIRITDIQKGE